MSTNRRIYLDYNATAPLVQAAREAMVEAMAEVGNPSSVHAEGRRARDRVETARRHVAALVGRPREQIVFTSGGSEANWVGVMALARAAAKRGMPKVIATTRIDHPSLRGVVEALVTYGWNVVELPVDEHGTVMEFVPRDVGVFAAGLVNHELGTVLGDDVLAWARSSGALIHLDAVQAAGKLALDAIEADALAISAHKIGGPQGVAALAIAVDEELPIVGAGHQERGRRPGTENTLGIIGFGAAAAAVDVASWSTVAALGEALEGPLHASGVHINGGPARRVGGTVNARFAGALGESIVMGLDLAGIAVSTGAACTSGSVQPSPVLLALGLPPDRAREAVRFSLGRATTQDEIDQVLRILPAIVERARRHR